jgi:hypothetical protein
VKDQWIKTKLELDLHLGMANKCKDQWIKTKLELDLHLGMANKCKKYKMNI